MPTVFDLAAILTRQAISQSELARRSGLSLRTVNRIYLNTTSQVSLATLDKLADALGVAPGRLLAKHPAGRSGASR